MGSSGNVCQAKEGERLRYYISFIAAYDLTWEHFKRFSYLTETLETRCRRWLVTALEQVTSIMQLQTALHVVRCAAPVRSQDELPPYKDCDE